MKSICLLFTLIGLSSLLTACGYIQDRSLEYQESQNAQLTVPPDFCNAEVGDTFVIPNSNHGRCKTSLLPPESFVEQISEGKLTKKELKEREFQTRLTQIKWTQMQSGTEALMTDRGLSDTWHHVNRALEKLSTKYRIKNKNQALSMFTIEDLSAKSKTNMRLYTIHLSESESGTLIMLTLPGTTMPPSPDINQRILEKLYHALQETKEGLSLKQWLGW
jgi:uncharacterized lipoprotein